ncbi:hypothetical protein ACFFRR_006733 [Megaselia abdita]
MYFEDFQEHRTNPLEKNIARQKFLLLLKKKKKKSNEHCWARFFLAIYFQFCQGQLFGEKFKLIKTYLLLFKKTATLPNRTSSSSNKSKQKVMSIVSLELFLSCISKAFKNNSLKKKLS